MNLKVFTKQVNFCTQQRFLCPTHWDTREIWISVHLRVSGLEHTENMKQWRQWLWSQPHRTDWAYSPRKPNNSTLHSGHCSARRKLGSSPMSPQPCLSSCSSTCDSGPCLQWWPSQIPQPQEDISKHDFGRGGGACHPSAPSGDASRSSSSSSKAPAIAEAQAKEMRELATGLALAAQGGKCM